MALSLDELEGLNKRTTRGLGDDRLEPSKFPNHVAIIMDGNGRWAAKRCLPRIAGHRAGAEAVRRTVETAARLGIECLTLYAFSTENWKRPRLEVRALMDLLLEFIHREMKSMLKNNIRFRMIGRSEQLHISVLEQIRRAELATYHCTGLQLNIAVNYGGRAEIVDACRKLAARTASGRITLDQIDEQAIGQAMYTRLLPDPDLLIRTSGEMRVSNFLLWQIAYAEMHVTETLWPDFGEQDFYDALVDYQGRERRFGAVNDPAQGGIASDSITRFQARG
jgi:undecaprenyl diphosphate synthase